jgi:hypothetical protein
VAEDDSKNAKLLLRLKIEKPISGKLKAAGD